MLKRRLRRYLGSAVIEMETDWTFLLKLFKN